jgi:hypothetical protein
MIRFDRTYEIDQMLGLEGLTLVDQFADAIVQHMIDNSPVRTGFLKSRNHKENDGEGRVAVNDAPYAAANNYGFTAANGRYIPGSHFADRAISQAELDMENLVRRVFG